MTRAGELPPRRSCQRRAQRAVCALALLLALAAVSCKKSRLVPICAVRDCKSGQIIDDGCGENGKCKSCVNDCGGGRVAPRNGPQSPSLPLVR